MHVIPDLSSFRHVLVGPLLVCVKFLINGGATEYMYLFTKLGHKYLFPKFQNQQIKMKFQAIVSHHLHISVPSLMTLYCNHWALGTSNTSDTTMGHKPSLLSTLQSALPSINLPPHTSTLPLLVAPWR